jgi:signal recognition particle receptor subunit beta
MASFDSERGAYIVRVVYDGPGMAGKTTNLKRICEIVPTERRSEMVTPAELKGRTMFFDWLEVEGPKKNGTQLCLQLITVPGQIERNYRRRPLVENADVVVFVGDSTPEGMPDTLRTFARLKVSMRRRKTPVPLVVQANKQDVKGALTADRFRRRLKLEPETPILPAAAVSGRGVRETLALASRLGLSTVADDAELGPIARAFADADTLFDHVLSFEDEPNNEEPIEIEEVNVHASDEHVDEALLAQLGGGSLGDLEARARRAAGRSAEARTSSGK